jgi:hypothetical protein
MESENYTSHVAGNVFDGSAEVLPPELLPHIADALPWSARGTLVNLLCASRRTYALCLPSLMRSIEIAVDWDAPHGGLCTVEKVKAFAEDGLGAGKFSHVRHLLLDGTLDGEENRALLETICRAFVGLVSLSCGTEDIDYTPTLLWSFVRTRNFFPNLRVLEVDNPVMCYDATGISDPEFFLPPPLEKVKVYLHDGTDAQFLCFYRDLDRLPRLTSLELSIFGIRDQPPPYSKLFDFPRLLRRIKKLSSVAWPKDAELLAKTKALETLHLKVEADAEMAEPDCGRRFRP